MLRYQVPFLIICLLLPCTGCQNGWLSSSPTIPPPPTYSLNIPSVSANQPYYNPNQSAAVPSAIPANTAVANPAVNPVGGAVATTPTNPAQLNGWIAKSDNAVASPGAVQTGPTTFVNTAPSTVIQTASNTATPGTGTSFTSTPNYQTTSVNEAADQSRLPATDASQVRAPAFGNPTAQSTRFSQLPPPAGTGYNGGPVYSGTPMVSPQGAPIYGSQPTNAYAAYQGAPVVNSGGTVLASSTATYNAANGSQLGWQGREVSNNSGSYNR